MVRGGIPEHGFHTPQMMLGFNRMTRSFMNGLVMMMTFIYRNSWQMLFFLLSDQSLQVFMLCFVQQRLAILCMIAVVFKHRNRSVSPVIAMKFSMVERFKFFAHQFIVNI